MALAQSFARKLEGLEEKAKRDLHQLDGAKGALKQAADAIEQHRAYYQAAVDRGDLDGPSCTLAMDVITRCVGGLQNLADKAQLAATLKTGELRGLSQGIDTLEKEFNEERKRLQAVASLVEYDGRPDAAAQDIQRRKQTEKEGADAMAGKPKKPKKAAAPRAKPTTTRKDRCKPGKKKAKRK